MRTLTRSGANCTWGREGEGGEMRGREGGEAGRRGRERGEVGGLMYGGGLMLRRGKVGSEALPGRLGTNSSVTSSKGGQLDPEMEEWEGVPGRAGRGAERGYIGVKTVKEERARKEHGTGSGELVIKEDEVGGCDQLQ